MYKIRKRDDALKHTTENREVLQAPTLAVLQQQIKRKQANGYEIKGEIKQQANGYWGCLVVKEIKFRERVGEQDG